ncbi:lytic transglycosylase domain-containing protein [Paracoccus shanxieyensis]|uniref:Transglycosylase SLT domain-containing protein n=1 Tax=Paracoccus shanxieyensis TaxID=2675752 RepID=A0A6L6IX78_9RHOB|nr:lytic transglycosylase domain-containing protein [Paracoccus shanxieyensis]MTH63204.1 transglycosylase SLT domain-containing protein [Paracoccus shanxieyensis]MTH87118.1 transglycosylase SLT domain-containing protein [Paracoccus shanxieyensis]
MRRLVIALLAALIPATAPAYEALDAMQGVAAPRPSAKSRCTDDARYCISISNYVPDVCAVIEQAAMRNDLDPHFFARLLWKESLFEAGAISPVGAMGIAQFMPGTAEIVGLDDPFNPAKAIAASARYLKQLSDGLGNVGLAAVAYNGGENRAARFIAQGGNLPWETQDYVQAITGLTAWNWREKPGSSPDLRLDKARPFRAACVDLAGSRKLREFKTPDHAWPWGVIVATHPSQSGVTSQVSRLNKSLRPILGGKRVSYVRRKVGGSARKVYTAQIGYSSKTEAYAFCTRLRSFGGRCIVLKN